MDAHAPRATATPPPAGRMQRIWRFFREIGPAGPVALLATCRPAVGVEIIIGFVPHIVALLHRSGAIGCAIFIICFATLGGFALVPTWLNSTLAGWTYKFPIGFPVTM